LKNMYHLLVTVCTNAKPIITFEESGTAE